MSTSSDPHEMVIPPVLPNEIELVLKNFKEKVIYSVSKHLDKGENPNKIKELHSTTIYSEWKEIPNFLFRIMFFPVCPHSEGGSSLSNFKISAYVEASRKHDWPENWMCYGTRFCIIVINNEEPHASIFKRDTFNFSKTETDRGWQGILSLSQILENGFLNNKGDLVIRAGVYPVGAEIDRSARDPNYDCRKSTGFIGLQNHGATCYMNALLQSLYSITKFRKSVYSLTFDFSHVMGSKSYQIIQNLINQYYVNVNFNTKYKIEDNSMDVDNPYPESNFNTSRNEVKSLDGMKGLNIDELELDDQENDEKLDEFLDKLDENDYCNLLLEEEEKKRKVPSVGLALQNLFYLLKYSHDSPACKELMKSFGWDSSDMFTQQDSHELLKLLLDKMEEQMKGTSVEGSVKNIFEGEMETYIECIDIDYKSCRKETFEDIQLDVQGCSNIYESMDKLTEPELLAGDNMYEAKGHGKQRANKGIRFTKFPPVVIFLLKRFTFDLTKMDTVKLNNRFEFYKQINLAPYLQPSSDNCTSTNTENNSDTDKNPSKELNKNKNTSRKYKTSNPKDLEYVLQAVSVHHGSINSGHYYAFAKNEKNEWFKFDDEIVTKVSEYAVINDNFGGEDRECYNYLTTSNPNIYGNNLNRYRRNKVYNAYILIYVLKNKIGEYLGEVDMYKENYQVTKRCKLQKILMNLRNKIRERLNRYLKIKVFTPKDFQGNTLLNQHFNTWSSKLVITQDKNTSLKDVLKYIHLQFAEGEDGDVSNSLVDSTPTTTTQLDKVTDKNKNNKLGKLSEDNLEVYFYVLGLNKQFNRFMCLNDVKNKHKIVLDTLQDLSQLIRKEYYQQFDPTLYLLYLDTYYNMSNVDASSFKDNKDKNIMRGLKISPRSSLDVFSPTSSTSGGIFTPTSSVFTTSTLLGLSPKSSTLCVFIKYYDIFSKNGSENLKLLRMTLVSYDRNTSQLLRDTLESLVEFMSKGLVTEYRLKDLNNIVKTLNTLEQSELLSDKSQSNLQGNGMDSKVIQEEHVKNTNKRMEQDEEDSTDKHVLLLDEEEDLSLDLDNKIDLVMKKESLHLYWYIEIDNNFTNLLPYKKLGDQLTNGDVLVCNFRPTDEMRKQIEQIEQKTNQKEDFEQSLPLIPLQNTNHFMLCSTDEYLDTLGLSPSESLKYYRELRVKWKVEHLKKMEQFKLYSLSIYDYPSYIQWKLNNIKVVFKLYDPLQQLAQWKNCSNSLVMINAQDDLISSRDTSRECSREPLIKDSSNANDSREFKEKNTARDKETSRDMYKDNREQLVLERLELVVDLRTPCKHVLRYVCWAMGVDPCHVLVFNNVPHTFESIGSNLYSLDDFCHKDYSLGYIQQPLLQLFNTQGIMINTNNMNLYSSVSDDNDEDLDMDDGFTTNSGRQLTKYNLRRLGSGGSGKMNDYQSNMEDENVIHLGILFEPYYMWNYKFNQQNINVVAQIFNDKVQVVCSLMCKVSIDTNVAQLCHIVSNNYIESSNSAHKRSNQKRTKLCRDDDQPYLVLVDVLNTVYNVVDLNLKVLELPQYSNSSIRNLFASPLRFVPNWTPEQHELLKDKKLCTLTVFHQTPDHEYFGHSFQVLVSPTWTFLQIKTHIRNTLDVPKREWDRWTFYQISEPHVRTWKSNDDLLDWDKPGLKLLAEHPKPYEKSKSFGIMKIT